MMCWANFLAYVAVGAFVIVSNYYVLRSIVSVANTMKEATP